MNESARAHSITRRAFLRRATVVTAGVSAALIVGEEAWEAFERLGPRRLLVPGVPKVRWTGKGYYFDQVLEPTSYEWGVLWGGSKGYGKTIYHPDHSDIGHVAFGFDMLARA